MLCLVTAFTFGSFPVFFLKGVLADAADIPERVLVVNKRKHKKPRTFLWSESAVVTKHFGTCLSQRAHSVKIKQTRVCSADVVACGRCIDVNDLCAGLKSNTDCKLARRGDSKCVLANVLLLKNVQ